jgi:hypothetical protein
MTVVARRSNCIPVSYFVHVSTMFPQPVEAQLFRGSYVPGASPPLVSVTYMDFICVDSIPAAIARALTRSPVTKHLFVRIARRPGLDIISC